MPMTRPTTGCHPDRFGSRTADPDFRHAEPPLSGLVAEDSFQPVAWVRNQRNFGSCVGQAIASSVEGINKARGLYNRKVSAVSIWREARRLQGRLERIDQGTRIEYGLTGLVARGWDPYREGEDRDPDEAGKQDDLADELFADDKRYGQYKRWRVRGERKARVDQVVSALVGSFGVVIGCFLRPEFFAQREHDRALGFESFGGGENSHAMRVFGVRYRDGRRHFAVQNSWGTGWGGIYIEPGDGEKIFRPGCCWVDEFVLGDSGVTHDIHCLEVVK